MKYLLLILFLTSVSFSAQVSIKLKAKADVEVGAIILSEIAEIKGDAELVKKIAELEVGRVSVPGRKTRITEKSVKEFFLKHVVDSKDIITFSGAKFCNVVARSALISKDSINTLLLETIRSKMNTNLKEGKDWVFEATKIPNNIVAPTKNGHILINMTPNFSEKGKEMAIVQIFSGDKIISRHSVPFVIKRFEKIAVLKNNVAKGEIINESDFKMEKQETTFQKRKIITNSKDAIGRTTIRSLRAGDILVDNSLTLPYAVKEGESIKLFVSIGNTTVQTTALAQKSAFKGQTITVKNIDTGKNILATVSGAGEAFVN